MNATQIIQAEELTRAFKDNIAVNALDLNIAAGELFGLVGPDGAGKTTTLRLLAGLLDITSGQATVAGYDLKTESEKIKTQIGYMAQEFSLYAELTVAENLRFFAELYDVERAELKPRMERLLTFAGLTEFKDRWATHLSGGMQKKLALACTLIHEPTLLLLDEPTTGVDPVSRREFWNILNDLHLRGTTIIVSTPYMDEADRCSQVGMMYQGQLVVCDSPRNIRSQIKGEMIQVLPDNRQKTLDLFQDTPGVFEIQTYGEALHILVDEAEKRLPEFEKLLKKAKIKTRTLRKAPMRMEEAFISLIRKLEA